MKSEIRKHLTSENKNATLLPNTNTFLRKTTVNTYHRITRKEKMGLLEFSWATITLIDIGVLSISVLGLWWLKNQVDRYKTLSEELEKRYNTLHREHETLQQEHNTLLLTYENLQQEFSNFQSAADQRYNALQQQQEILKAENATLRAGLDALTREHKALQTAHDRLSGRHAELVERVMPVFEILAREKLMEINAHNES